MARRLVPWPCCSSGIGWYPAPPLAILEAILLDLGDGCEVAPFRGAHPCFLAGYQWTYLRRLLSSWRLSPAGCSVMASCLGSTNADLMRFSLKRPTLRVTGLHQHVTRHRRILKLHVHRSCVIDSSLPSHTVACDRAKCATGCGIACRNATACDMRDKARRKETKLR